MTTDKIQLSTFHTLTQYHQISAAPEKNTGETDATRDWGDSPVGIVLATTGPEFNP